MQAVIYLCERSVSVAWSAGLRPGAWWNGSNTSGRRPALQTEPLPLFLNGYHAWIALFCLSCHTASAFYNPETGRWLTRDPITEVAFSRMQIGEYQHTQRDEARLDRVINGHAHEAENLFVFVRNQVLESIDPDGLRLVIIMQVGDVTITPCPVCPPRRKCIIFHSPAGRGGGAVVCCGGDKFSIRTGGRSRAEIRDDVSGMLTRIGPNTFICFCDTFSSGMGGACKTAGKIIRT